MNTFKNETGYSRTQQAVQPPPKMIQKPPPKEEIQQPPPVQVQKASTPEKEKSSPESEIMKAPEQKPEDKSEKNTEEKDKAKEKDPKERAEKKKEVPPGEPISSHDESDYEDNITVTVPPAHMQSHGPPRTYNGNSSRKSREGGYYVSCNSISPCKL